MKQIFINLKRFEAPRRVGGLATVEDPAQWIETIISETAELAVGHTADVELIYFLAEGLIVPARRRLRETPQTSQASIALGCQGVHWEDIEVSANFGAFTSRLPATSARFLGCSWALIGHSEERLSYYQVIEAFEPAITEDFEKQDQAWRAIDLLLNGAVHTALNAGLNVLLCVGETLSQRGEGDFEFQKPRIARILQGQLQRGLQGVKTLSNQAVPRPQVVIAYEPVWAIGPGKQPPDSEYIDHMASLIKELVSDHFGFVPNVVYGGGLKAQNAAMLAAIASIDGGLVGLTNFSEPIGFDVGHLAEIIELYLSQARQK